MDGQFILLIQIDGLARRLDWVQDLLRQVHQSNSGFSEQFYLRSGQLIDARRGEITRLRQAAKKAGPLDPAWQELEKVSEECEHLFGEAFAYLGGIFLRQNEIDRQMCHIADGLCSHLSARTQVFGGVLVLPAMQDSFTGLTDIIRLRFPDFTIWSLPVVAHEFGHFVENERSGKTFPYLFGRLLQAEGLPAMRGDPAWRMLQEQFADLYAVYTLGPAYVYTCIFTEFDPRMALLAQQDHPSYAERTYFLLKTLDRMQASDIPEPYTSVISQLSTAWELALQSLGLSPITSSDAIDRRLDALYAIIDDPKNQLAGAGYKRPDWMRARRLSAKFAELIRQDANISETEIQHQVKAMYKETDVLTLPDVLNAAWLCRLGEAGEQRTESINRMAVAACLPLLGD